MIQYKNKIRLVSIFDNNRLYYFFLNKMLTFKIDNISNLVQEAPSQQYLTRKRNSITKVGLYTEGYRGESIRSLVKPLRVCVRGTWFYVFIAIRSNKERVSLRFIIGKFIDIENPRKCCWKSANFGHPILSRLTWWRFPSFYLCVSARESDQEKDELWPVRFKGEGKVTGN